VGVIGPNGSGKTTLIRAITKIMKPVHGEVLLDEEPIDALSFKELAQRVAVVEDWAISTSRSGSKIWCSRQNSTPARFLRSWKRGRSGHSREAMRLTGILELAERMVESLSSGERQLVFIARALAQEPSCSSWTSLQAILTSPIR